MPLSIKSLNKLIGVNPRLKEPSSWAGIGLIIQGLFQLYESKGGDASAFGTIGAGIAAIFLPEKTEPEVSGS